MNRILLTGGSGRLGTEMQKHMKFLAPSQEDMDITKSRLYADGYYNGQWNIDAIVHGAAYTDVGKAEKDQYECYNVNVNGTRNLLDAYPHTPFIFISTEYAWNPVNVYGYTKALAEELVKKHKAPWLILRTLFKPNPWPYESAFTDQYTQGDYVNKIAELIIYKIWEWNLKSDTEYIGTGRKTIYDLAKRTKPDVKKGSVGDFKDYPIPHDYIRGADFPDITKFEKITIFP